MIFFNVIMLTRSGSALPAGKSGPPWPHSGALCLAPWVQEGGTAGQSASQRRRPHLEEAPCMPAGLKPWGRHGWE